MKTGKTLSQLAAEIERQHETKRDYVANLDAVTMIARNGEPRLAVEGTGNFGVTEIAHNQIAGHTNISKPYYDRMRREAPVMQKMKQVTNLTPAQEARFPEFVRKWIDIGLSTAPADRTRAEAAIAGLYKLANLKEPRVIWLPCPISAALSAVAYAKAINRLAPRDVEVHSAVDSAVRSAVDSAGHSYFGGSIWNAGYFAWADYFNEVCGIAIDRNFLEMTQTCGFYWTLDGVCFASERPSEINLDAEGRLHSETGMSIKYAGTGWGLFNWHGTQVPGEWIVNRASLTPSVALKQQNVEQRRAACEILGWANILRELKAKTIDHDNDPEIGDLVEVKLPDLRKKAKFLRVRCGTGREFAIGIPPHINKALDAQAWIIGLEPSQFQPPEVRA